MKRFLILLVVLAIGTPGCPYGMAADPPAPLFQWTNLQGVLLTPGQQTGTYAIVMPDKSIWQISPMGTPVPPPPNPPVPPVPPNPPVPPPPAQGLSALFIYETADLNKLPPAQLSIVGSLPLREYLKANCAKDAKGNPQFKFFDPDANMAGEDPVLQEWFKRPRKSVPWVIVSNGKDFYEGPWAGSVAEMTALLDKYRKPAGGPK